MIKNEDDIYTLKGTLTKMTGGFNALGQITRLDYIEVDGERWGGVVILGSMDSELESAIGKEVELHFLSDKKRFLMGFRVVGEKRFHTAEKTIINKIRGHNIWYSRIAPVIIGVASSPIFFKIGGFGSLIAWGVLFVGWVLIADLATSGKLWRKANNYIAKYNTVR
jgi:hypothetical protein